ncbi:MAG TPA: Fur family transcriptional regulator [Anaerolineales bacterium]|nr:Fur family transcriptional regulator [Anaerolineales bacterium]
MEDPYTHQLRARGFRLTPQRYAILNVLLDAGGHLSPTEVFHRASGQLPGLTEPTVYRTLAFLAEQGLIMAAHMGNGQLVYEAAEHIHHHLICRSCSGSIQIAHDALQELYNRLYAETGFRADSSHVTLFGLCPECQSPTQE